jgi:hypothetical protein
MKILCDVCHNIIWPKTAKMTVTPHDPKKGKKEKYHFGCWLEIATKDQIYEISKAFQKHKERNLNEQFK